MQQGNGHKKLLYMFTTHNLVNEYLIPVGVTRYCYYHFCSDTYNPYALYMYYPFGIAFFENNDHYKKKQKYKYKLFTYQLLESRQWLK